MRNKDLISFAKIAMLIVIAKPKKGMSKNIL